jgi:hypothetical protein
VVPPRAQVAALARCAIEQCRALAEGFDLVAEYAAGGLPDVDNLYASLLASLRQQVDDLDTTGRLTLDLAQDVACAESAPLRRAVGT